MCAQSRKRRVRSARHPAVALDEALAHVAAIHDADADGLDAKAVARALGHRSIKTKGFSTRLSAARQFGLLELREGCYRLTDLARELRADPSPAARRRAFVNVPLYGELLIELGGKPLPTIDALASRLFHDHGSSASARRPASSAFLDSARQAGLIGPGETLRVDSSVTPPTETGPPLPAAASGGTRIVLRLWGRDEGKTVEIDAPASITDESLERIVEAIRVHVRVIEAR